MFIKTCYGYLINIDTIKTIYILSADEKNEFNRVTAVIERGEVTLYKNIEIQHCQTYLTPCYPT